jgi:transposase
VNNWLEGQRLRGWELAQAGWKQKDIAIALGVTKGAVSQWLKRGREGGMEALRRHPAPGAPSKLSSEQAEKLPQLLSRGAEAYGFRGKVWTHARIAAVIQHEFSVKYHANHIARILRKIGWSRQKPRRRATQRDEVAIAHWAAQEWPMIKKRARG